MIEEKIEMCRSTVFGHWIIRKNGVVYRTWTTDIDEAMAYVEYLETKPIEMWITTLHLPAV